MMRRREEWEEADWMMVEWPPMPEGMMMDWTTLLENKEEGVKEDGVKKRKSVCKEEEGRRFYSGRCAMEMTFGQSFWRKKLKLYGIHWKIHR
jgi:hypothetical protein